MKHWWFKASSWRVFSILVICFSVSFLLLVIPGYLSAAGITTVTVFEKAEIQKDKIRLGEIAKIRGEDRKLNQELKAVVIGTAPLPGKSRRIDGDYIKIRLKQNRIELSQISLHVPKKVEVSRSFVEIPKKKIEKIVLDFICKQMPCERNKVRVKNVRINRKVILPKGKVTYEVVPPKNAGLLGKIPMLVLFKVDGDLKKRVWVTVDIEVLTKVVVTRKPLGRYQLITEDDIRLKEMDLARLPSNTITSARKVLGKRAKRPINPNVVLTTGNIESPPLVKRGDVVGIIAESRGLRISALGKAKERGHLGQRIRVINLDSNKEIYARVVDKKEVKVDFW